MPALTAANLPYPLETDPVAHMAQLVQLLAEKIGDRYQSGQANVVFSAAPSASVVVTFPTPFAEAPVVTATPIGATTMVVGIAVVSATQATITLRHYEATATTATVAVGWHAHGKPPG